MLRSVSVFFMSIFIFSCASTALTIDPVPLEYRQATLKYFVENHGRDQRGLDKIIASELQRHGLSVSSGYQLAV